jgi:hypothetical protein
VRKCLSLRGVHNYSPVHLRDGLDFLRDAVDRFPFEALVSPAVGLADLDEAFSLSRQRQWMRVAVAPNQESP